MKRSLQYTRFYSIEDTADKKHYPYYHFSVHQHDTSFRLQRERRIEKGKKAEVQKKLLLLKVDFMVTFAESCLSSKILLIESPMRGFYQIKCLREKR